MLVGYPKMVCCRVELGVLRRLVSLDFWFGEKSYSVIRLGEKYFHVEMKIILSFVDIWVNCLP